MPKIVPIILAGGTGSRLWPVSTPDVPKQFLPLKTGGTCFSNTVDRASDPRLFAPPIILCAEGHEMVIQGLLRDKVARVVCEPVGRNTAPAFCVGAIAVPDDDTFLLFLPSDHHIPDVAAFCQAVSDAMPLAQQGMIVTFGVKPLFAHNQYGYIRREGGWAGVDTTLKNLPKNRI